MSKPKETKRKLRIHFGFPIVEEGKGDRPQEKGISLLIALMTTTVMMGIAADVILTSAVNLELAVASRDKVKAEYLLKSGQNMAIFAATVSHGIDLFRAQPSTPAAFKRDLIDSDESIWNTLNGMPAIGASTVEFLNSASGKDNSDPFGLRGVLNESVANKMALFTDYFSIKIEDEGSKINVNDCSKGRCAEVVSQLKALFACPAEKEFLESKNQIGRAHV